MMELCQNIYFRIFIDVIGISIVLWMGFYTVAVFYKLLKDSASYKPESKKDYWDYLCTSNTGFIEIGYVYRYHSKLIVVINPKLFKKVGFRWDNV